MAEQTHRKIHGVDVPAAMANTVESWVAEFEKQCPVNEALEAYTSDVVAFLEVSMVTLDAVLGQAAWQIAQTYGYPYKHRPIAEIGKPENGG